MNLVQLTRTDHAALRIDPAKAGAAASNVHLVPIVRSEFRRACSHYPVFFAKHAETGQFYPAVLMGLEPNENLYWTGDALEPGYVPLNLLRLPFYVGGEDADGGVVCVDMDSPGVVSDGGCAILNHDGGDSDYIGSIHAILNELAAQREVTRTFVDLVLTRKLISEVKLDIVFDDRTSVAVAGLYGIDERALAQEAGSIRNLDDVIALAGMILSLEHVAGLVRRRNTRIAAMAEWLRPSA